MGDVVSKAQFTPVVSLDDLYGHVLGFVFIEDFVLPEESHYRFYRVVAVFRQAVVGRQYRTIPGVNILLLSIAQQQPMALGKANAGRKPAPSECLDVPSKIYTLIRIFPRLIRLAALLFDNASALKALKRMLMLIPANPLQWGDGKRAVMRCVK